MKQYILICSRCKQEITNDAWWLSPCCGATTNVRYGQTASTPQFPLNNTVLQQSPRVGNTPLVKLPRLSARFGCTIWAKCEQQNPTGSFKDRGSIIELAKAQEYGNIGIVCASTGNMAVSLSATAAKFGLRCVDVIPQRTANGKLDLMQRCGGELITIHGSYDDCVGIAQTVARKQNLFLCGDYTLRREGQKTIGWELAMSGVPFDAVVIPVGNGNLGTAIYQGLQEARPSGAPPQCIGVQPMLCNPITVAWRKKRAIVTQNPAIRTKAAAFDVGNPLDGNNILHRIKETNGIMIDASDDEMQKGQSLLAREEGILGELAVGASIATLEKIKMKLANKTVAIIISGSGLSGE